MKTRNLVACLASLTLCSVPLSAGEVVYDNSINDLSLRFETTASRVGDEITLAGSARLLETFAFEFYYTNSSSTLGSPSIELSLNANNGPEYNGYATPGTELWNSGTLSGLITSFTDRATLNFDQSDFGSAVLLPETFTWSVKFSGLAANDLVGLDMYNPPLVGSSLRDYWIDTGSGWELKEATVDPANNPINFAAKVTTVPEPSILALLLLGGLGGASWRRRS